MPAPLVTLIYYLKYRCLISPRAEVELSPWLSIGKHSQVSSFCKIKATDGPLTIGSNVSIGPGCFIASDTMGITIGDDCLIGPNVTITANNYKYDRLDIPIVAQGKTSKGIGIGDNVWIGAGACILDGSEVGSGVIIGPNSVVSTRIPSNTILQGNPAKVLFTRR